MSELFTMADYQARRGLVDRDQGKEEKETPGVKKTRGWMVAALEERGFVIRGKGYSERELLKMMEESNGSEVQKDR